MAVSRSGLTRLPANRSNIVVPTSTCWYSGTGRCSETTTSWLPRTSAEPVAELLGVAHRRRQRHHLHVLGQVDDHLLPDGPAEAVGEVVHLVHDDEAEPGRGSRPGVEHVAQHLGGHDDDRGLAVDRGVPGQQPDPSAPCGRTRSWYFWFDRALIGVV
jgi:hypothetical protein